MKNNNDQMYDAGSSRHDGCNEPVGSDGAL